MGQRWQGCEEWGRRVGACALAVLLTVSWSDRSAVAAPASTATCLQVWDVMHGRDHSAVRALIAKGPDAVLPTLSKKQVQAIRDYITATETMKFRCTRFIPPPPLNPRRP